MTQELYVYIPGFEYDSKGPLEIDAIKLEAYIGNERISTYLNITNSTLIEGDTIYKCNQSNGSAALNMSRISQQIGAAELPQHTSKQYRAHYGYFYDFVTDKSDLTHHIIGFYNEPVDNQYSSNMNVEEHDGLFLIKLSELNTDIDLHFTFYSRIPKDTTDLYSLNSHEKVVSLTSSQANIFTQEAYTEFFETYVEVAKFNTSYNPLTSGLDPVTFQTAAALPQFFNLKKGWDNDEKTWELPVNADVLVSDLSIDSNKVDTAEGNYYKQYKYDTTNLKHILGTDLECNSEQDHFEFYKKFYDNYYKKSCISKKLYEDEENLQMPIKGSGAIYAQSYARQGDYQPLLSINLKNTRLTGKEFLYYLTYTDLSNFHYLYNINPTINLQNRILDSTPGLNAVALFTSLTIYRNILGDWYSTDIAPFKEGNSCFLPFEQNDAHTKTLSLFDCYSIPAFLNYTGDTTTPNLLKLDLCLGTLKDQPNPLEFINPNELSFQLKFDILYNNELYNSGASTIITPSHDISNSEIIGNEIIGYKSIPHLNNIDQLSTYLKNTIHF